MNQRGEDNRLCNNCGTDGRHGIEDRCRACNYPVAQWAPNVQAAARTNQVTALEARYQTARSSALARGVGDELQRLESLAGRADTVVSMPIGLAYDLFTRSDATYAPYAKLVAGGVRSPANLDSDRRRRTVDSLLYGHYAETIVFGSLSTDGRGLSSYGAVHTRLRESTVAYRSTVLEENSFSFVRRHEVGPDKPFPAGRLSRWEERHKLAVSKLAPKIKAGMSESECSELILHPAESRDLDEFLEVHVYGNFNFQAVSGLRVLTSSAQRTLRDRVEGLQVRVLKKRSAALSLEWSEE